jgi:hypothetical protein
LVLKLLSKRSELLSKRYEAIILALEYTRNPESIIQAAHSARFLIKHLHEINPEAPIYKPPVSPLNEISKFAGVWKNPENAEAIFQAGKELTEYFE